MYAATGPAPASIISLDGNFASKLQGAQKENIYFGTNGSSGTVKWRVLDTGDNNRYGSGMLLWADKQIAAEAYNSYYMNPEYAFWGTSLIRAKLNGGMYYNPVSNENAVPNPAATTTISVDDSYYGKLFTTAEKSSIVLTGSYTTDDYGFDTSAAQFLYEKWEITVNEDGVYGKYNSNRINSSHPMSQYATVTAQNGVQETTTSDKLFLLDYYDINKVIYGFSDNGKNYATQVAEFANSKNSSYSATWDESSSWYPGVKDGMGQLNNTIYADYLKFSGEESDGYWIRPAGRRFTTYSNALSVRLTGCVSFEHVTTSNGVRPAFNFDPETVLYATAASLDTVNSTLTLVDTPKSYDDGKPAYKVYLKNGSYAAYNSTAKAKIAINDRTLNVAYNNPTVTTAGSGVTSGKLVLLLSNEDGEVKYQAEQPMNSSASNAGTTTTTFTLPQGLTYTDYTANLLFVSANGGVASETVYCSYNLESSSVETPADVNKTYDNTSKWIGDLQGADVPDWYDKEVHGSTAFVTVDSILYTDNDGKSKDSEIYNAATSSVFPEIKAAGKYKVTLKLADGLKWSSGDATDKKRSFTITIAKATPKVNVKIDGEVPHYVPTALPTIKLDDTKENTPGTVKWKDAEANKPKAGANNYAWTYTPTDTNNYLTKEDGVMALTFYAPEISTVEITNFNPDGKDIFTTTTLGEFTKLFKVKVSYKDNATAAVEDYKDFTVVVNNKTVDPTSTANFLKAGNNTLVVRVKDAAKNNAIIQSNPPLTISGVKELGFEELDSVALDTGEFVYPVTAKNILDDIVEISVKLNDGTSDFASKTDDAEKLAKFLEKIEVVEDASTLKVGDEVSVTFRIKGLTTEEAKFAETIKITKGTYEIADSLFEDKTVTYTGSAFDPAGWIDTTKLPTGMTVTYSCDGDDWVTLGTRTVTATFSNPDPDNYNDPATKTAQLTISDKNQYKKDNLSFTVTGGATGENGAYTATYDPAKTIGFVLGGKLSDKDGNEIDESVVNVTRNYKYEKKIDGEWKDAVAADLKDAGTYRITVTLSAGDATYDDAKMIAELTIAKADFDMAGVTFDNDTVTYDGKPHGLEIGGDELPEWITVTYTGNGVTEVGTHTVVAKFTIDDAHKDNYNAIADKKAKLTISDAVVTEIKAELAEKEYTTANTLDDLKAKLKVTAVYNNGTKQEVTDFELSCDGLRGGNKFKFGMRKITVTYTDESGKEFSTFVEINVEKVKVALPTFKGGLKYTGLELKPKAADFNGYDETLMTFVVDKLQSGLTVGSYKAVFALKDFENYEWATATTYKKALFAVTYDEVVLNANEAAVDWNISKAVLTATKSDGALPVFASDSYVGAFSDVVTLKYFKDEACTEEVAAADLAHETQYFVKAELLDTDNFELDTSAAQYTVKSFTYTTPAKELTGFQKVLAILKANWLWIVIAAAALILLILIIVLAARSAKKKREREERRLAEEKAERERKEEREEQRRREDREERMARMSQAQAAPQPQYIPQPMPQMMGQMQMPQAAPQAAQPAAAGGGAISPELLAIITGMNGKIEKLQSDVAANELAAAREELAMTRTELTIERMRGNGSSGDAAIGGLTAATLAEIVTAAMEKVLSAREKPAAQATPAAPETATAATQVPPDAVMTTVTTTKIDTTKKPAQNAQAQAAPVRTVVRNVVAPMPVDDGRVFDVGGFYKPADPVTDMGFTDDDKSE